MISLDKLKDIVMNASALNANQFSSDFGWHFLFCTSCKLSKY